MLHRRTAANGVVYYSSPLLESAGVPHAFSTRVGGVSGGAFESLNLGNPSNAPLRDSDEHLVENSRRFLAAIGCGDRRMCRVRQVHGATVARAGECDGMAADAIVADTPDLLASVRVADCVPVLLATRDGQRVAAMHAGWRGVVAAVVPAALREMGVTPKQILAAIGPCISADAFDVGPEVADEFERAGMGAAVSRRVGDKAQVDLRAAVRRQLLDAGVPRDAVEASDRCTYRHAEEFFSHRRESGLTGRMAAVIGVRV